MRAGHEDVESGFSRTGNDPLDGALDRELRAAIQVAPSPALTARIRTQIANEPTSTGWRSLWVYAGGALAAVAVLVAAVSVARRSGVTPEAPAHRATTALATVPVARSAEAPVERPVATREIAAPKVELAMAAVAAPAPAIPVEPAVQFSQSEMRGLQRLVRLATMQDTDLARLLAEPAWKSGAGIQITEVQIAPVVIEPLEPGTQAEPGTF